MATAKAPCPDAKCREGFIGWAMKSHWIVREDEDIESDPVWQAWKSAWYMCRSSSYYEANRRAKEQFGIKSKPIPDAELKNAWIRFGNGKDFARWIEKYHGIK
jgi:hypothetical protein